MPCLHRYFVNVGCAWTLCTQGPQCYISIRADTVSRGPVRLILQGLCRKRPLSASSYLVGCFYIFWNV